MDEHQTYEVHGGVRRAKAAWLCGKEIIEAQINGGPVFSVPIQDLRSPYKDSIDVSGISGMRRERVLRATKAGLTLPPIEAVPGSRGTTIEEVSVPQNEFDLFR